MTQTPFHENDLAQIRERGMDPRALRVQLDLFRDPPGHLEILRPATLGDGIRTIPARDREAFRGAFETGRAAGRFSKFVPASGAATRMFSGLESLRLRSDWESLSDLRALSGKGDTAAKMGADFFGQLDRFAFYPALREASKARGLGLLDQVPARRILDLLLGPEGLDLTRSSKGLVPFHWGGGKPRTALEEHLVEAVELTRDRSGDAHAHFTVLAEHRGRFQEATEASRRDLDSVDPAHLRVSFSEQDPSLDTLAAESDGSPARDHQGRLLFRPGGHGTLLKNLQTLNGDLVFLKNIDNVASGAIRLSGWEARGLLGGLAIRLRETLDRHLEDLEGGLPGPERLAEMIRFLEDEFGRKVLSSGREELRSELVSAMDRPLRVCGMVPNAGEPGGGPCWVRRNDGRDDLQIVESAQVDPRSPEQLRRLQSGTHFNPVDMVVCLKDRSGKPYDLSRFVEGDWALLSRKMRDGREIQILEQPGLWNGAMADWLTVFVEIPLECFHPVKTVMDLLRPGHQAKE